MLSAVFGLLVTLLSPWQTYWIPAGSMKPALVPGDYILALPMIAPPRRGEIVVFRHPSRDTVFVKRVVGLAADRVQMQGGILILNGAPVPQAAAPDHVELRVAQGPTRTIPRCANDPVAIGGDCHKRAFLETLPGGPTYTVLGIGPGAMDDTDEFVVPPGHVFVLGDNRDNSVDSRMSPAAGGMGYVPVANMIARPRVVLFSAAGATLWNAAAWRRGRMLVRVQ